MTRYKGRRMSRSVGITIPKKKNGNFVIHEHTKWPASMPFPHEESFSWILSKDLDTAKTIFVGEGNGAGTVKKPLQSAEVLYQTIAALQTKSSLKNSGVPVTISAHRGTDLHEYWIEQHGEGSGATYHIYYEPEDKTPFEILSAKEFSYDYVITRPLRIVDV